MGRRRDIKDGHGSQPAEGLLQKLREVRAFFQGEEVRVVVRGGELNEVARCLGEHVPLDAMRRFRLEWGPLTLADRLESVGALVGFFLYGLWPVVAVAGVCLFWFAFMWWLLG
jgi:hypothetical protein